MEIPREGYWQTTFSGRRVYALDPQPDDFCIEDIAHGLSNACRWGGQCATFYSVAEHSVRGSYMADNAYTAMEFLLHDASEAYFGDIVRPILRLMQELENLHWRTQQVINAKFGLGVDQVEMSEACREIDNRMMITEARHLFTHSDMWWEAPGFARPYDDLFVATRGKQRVGAVPSEPPELARAFEPDCWYPRQAKRLFLARYHELTKIFHPHAKIGSDFQ